jgi:hypothetical protein
MKAIHLFSTRLQAWRKTGSHLLNQTPIPSVYAGVGHEKTVDRHLALIVVLRAVQVSS